MSLDPEVYRGKYISEQSILIFDFKLRQGNIYEFSVIRQNSPLERITSAHHFRGVFKNGELNHKIISPEFANEIKGQEYCFKDTTFGMIFNKNLGRKQLAMCVGEHRILDLSTMNKALPSAAFWEENPLTSLKTANGYSRFFFFEDQIGFYIKKVLPNGQKVELERKLYRREDNRFRNLYMDWNTDAQTQKYIEEYEKVKNEARIREDWMDNSHDAAFLQVGMQVDEEGGPGGEKKDDEKDSNMDVEYGDGEAEGNSQMSQQMEGVEVVLGL